MSAVRSQTHTLPYQGKKRVKKCVSLAAPCRQPQPAESMMVFPVPCLPLPGNLLSPEATSRQGMSRRQCIHPISLDFTSVGQNDRDYTEAGEVRMERNGEDADLRRLASNLPRPRTTLPPGSPFSTENLLERIGIIMGQGQLLEDKLQLWNFKLLPFASLRLSNTPSYRIAYSFTFFLMPC